jgi:GTPase SAR1 family protein
VSAYDFRTLNDKDFEEIVIDLLSADFGWRLERFKPGKDQGIDGRWFLPDGAEAVVQCKHYVGSGFQSLLRSIVKVEKPKLEILKPARYLLATSVPLSRANKDVLVKALAPFVLRADDILGSDDLNQLLLRHPQIETAHYKLWLASTAVLQRIANHPILGRSTAELEEVKARSHVFVSTADHQTAREQLANSHVLILTGEPGVGKTTIARQLVLEHVVRGYELVSIEEDVSEAEGAFDPQRKQVFYFDDFLGRTYLEALRTKQDSHIATFVARVVRDRSKRMILTSRSNILNQGSSISDILSRSFGDKSRFEVSVSNLSKLERARILYNHLWHGELDERFVDELYLNRRYMSVIAHKNFNPRLIAFIVDAERLTTQLPENYWSYVVRTLSNPTEVWSHFFESQLSQECRDLAFFVALSGTRTTEPDLKHAFLSQELESKSHLGIVNHAFVKAVKHATGSVLNRTIDQSGIATYTLFNASIADYALRYLKDHALWRQYFPHLRSVSALAQLEQLYNAKQMTLSDYSGTLESICACQGRDGWCYDAYELRLARLIAQLPELAGAQKILLRGWLEVTPHIDSDSEMNDLYSLLESWKLFASEDDVRAFLEDSLLANDSWMPNVGTTSTIAKLVRCAKSAGWYEIRSRLRARALESLADSLEEFVREDDRVLEVVDHDDAGIVLERISEIVDDAFDRLDLDDDISWKEEQIEGIDVDGIISDNLASVAGSPDEDTGWPAPAGQTIGIDDRIQDLFQRD